MVQGKHRQSTVPASRFPSSSESSSRELAPDTVVAARPTGATSVCKFASLCNRQHVLLCHGEKVGVLAFYHGLLKFEPQNATAKVTGAVLGQESGSARKEFCQEGVLSGSGLCQEGILAGLEGILSGKSARKEFCQERFLSGSGLCQEGILSGGFLSGV